MAESMNLLLVGKTGAGKSSSGNSILGFEAFDAAQSANAVTRECQVQSGFVSGYNMKLVDGPGLADASLNDHDDIKHIINNAARAVAHTLEGFDAILIVIRVGRFAQEDDKVVKNLKHIYGDKFIKQYGIVLLTGGDKLEEEQQTLEEWVNQQEGNFLSLLSECHGRIIAFDNRTEDRNKRQNQINELISKVEELRPSERYLQTHYKQAKKARKRLIVSTKAPTILDKTKAEINKIQQDFDKIDFGDSEQASEKLRALRGNMDKLLDGVRKEDEDTGVLDGARDMIEALQKNIKTQLDLVKTNLERERKEKERRENMANLEAIHERERQRAEREVRVEAERQKLLEDELLRLIQERRRSEEQSRKKREEMLAKQDIQRKKVIQHNTSGQKMCTNGCWIIVIVVFLAMLTIYPALRK